MYGVSSVLRLLAPFYSKKKCAYSSISLTNKKLSPEMGLSGVYIISYYKNVVQSIIHIRTHVYVESLTDRFLTGNESRTL